mmetsp:Transcript_36752/g.35493  ORF Transcript_36752/g.35493 Transcript_36752/m.35493 type:complete len:100 (+) Transcript_36752:392-691(+)
MQLSLLSLLQDPQQFFLSHEIEPPTNKFNEQECLGIKKGNQKKVTWHENHLFPVVGTSLFLEADLDIGRLEVVGTSEAEVILSRIYLGAKQKLEPVETI